MIESARTAVVAVLLLAVFGCDAQAPPSTAEPSHEAAAKLPVKVVVVTMFERGEDEGDEPGEFQFWKERRDLDQRFEFPHSHHDLFYNPESQILGIVTGVGTAKAASSTMALGLDPRFDLTRAYWLVAGIAGIDPEDASIGSAAWSAYLVDGDLGHEIDVREIPEDWPFGYFARRTQRPFDVNKPQPNGEMFLINTGLRDWAYDLTQDVVLPDSPGLAHARQAYTEHPNALKPPFVLKGGHIAALTFWHGARMNEWANRWVHYWSDGETDFVTSAMEETGTYLSIEYLHNAGLVDKNRFMVLRAGSNFTMQPPGVGAAENLLRENEGYAGMEAALESLYLVGSVVIDEIIFNWARYRDEIPSSKST